MGTKVNQSAIELKDQGNKLYATRKYNDAIDCYTKAIVSLSVSEVSHSVIIIDLD